MLSAIASLTTHYATFGHGGPTIVVATVLWTAVAMTGLLTIAQRRRMRRTRQRCANCQNRPPHAQPLLGFQSAGRWCAPCVVSADRDYPPDISTRHRTTQTDTAPAPRTPVSAPTTITAKDVISHAAA